MDLSHSRNMCFLRAIILSLSLCLLTPSTKNVSIDCEFCADDRDLESYGVIYLIDCSILDTHIQQKERTAFKFLLRQSLVEE